MVSKDISIRIKLTHPAPDAPAVFARAVKDYSSRYGVADDIVARLKDVKVESVRNIVTTFNETEIGMGD